MAFYRRRRMLKKRGMRRPLKRFSRRKPTVRRLAKRVAGISRSLRKTVNWLDWKQTFTGVAATAPFTQFHINNYGYWSQTYLTGPFSNTAQGTDTAYDWVSSRINMNFKLDTDYDNITYTVFMVQLKDQFRNNQYDDQTGTLTLTADVHYTIQDGMTMLNKRFFVIRGIRKFTLGNFGVNPATVGDAGGSIDDYKQISFRLRPNKRILRQETGRNILGGGSVPPPTASQALPDPDPSKNYYILVFSNDASPASSQKINYIANHVVKSY